MDLALALQTARTAALEAGARILDVYGSSDTGLERKADGSPLTRADLAANEAILAQLREAFPDTPVLTEEAIDNPARLSSRWVWIVDPLDGTKEFLSRNGEFTVNIALTEAGAPVLGVVLIPVTGELYCAARGRGAFLERPGEAPRPLAVSARRSLGDMVAAVSRSHSDVATAALLERCGFASVRARGSSLKGCMIAAGEADVYFRLGPTNEWDICAMHAVIEGAGGVLTDLDGSPMRYNRPVTLNRGFVASNGAIHDRLVEMVRGKNGK
jgi:3'(2'), 5'-bisphosphate nucleotidase